MQLATVQSDGNPDQPVDRHDENEWQKYEWQKKH